MASLNLVQIIGRLGRDPELRYTSSGSPICSLNVATDESYTDRDGNKVERAEWHRVSVFQRQAENCANYLAKGSLVYVEGNLTTRKWQDQNGQERFTTEIKAKSVQFLDRREGSGEEQPQQGQPPRPQRQGRQREQPRPQGGSEQGQYFGNDEVPF